MDAAFRIPIVRRVDLSEQGRDSRAIARALDAGELIRVRPGLYVTRADTEAFTPEQRVIVRGRAWSLASGEPPVLSHVTAAAAHGLPLWDVRGTAVHVIAPAGRPGAGKGLVRHRGELRPDDLVELNGMSVTSLPQTVADVARTAPFTTAVCIADAALRLVAVDGPGTYARDRADEFRETAREIAARSAHGRGRAERVLDFADGRAQLPGESVSRIHLVTLGFAIPDLQVRVLGPDGRDFWIDFGLDDANAFGEFDGKGKYRDILLRKGLTMEEVLEREKQREDWIRGRTQRHYARWGGSHIATAITLGNRLAAFSIVPPRTPRG